MLASPPRRHRDEEAVSSLRASRAPVSARFQRAQAFPSGESVRGAVANACHETPANRALWLYGAAPESNRPSRGLHDRTGFEDAADLAWLSLLRRVRASPSARPYVRPSW